MRILRTIKRMFLYIAEYIPVPFGNVRMFLYKLAGLKMENGVTIEYGVQIGGSFENVHLKENVEIAQGVYLHAYDSIVIGKEYGSIGPFVKDNHKPKFQVRGQ